MLLGTCQRMEAEGHSSMHACEYLFFSMISCAAVVLNFVIHGKSFSNDYMLA